MIKQDITLYTKYKLHNYNFYYSNKIYLDNYLFETKKPDYKS